jgi:hypothetical protein
MFYTRIFKPCKNVDKMYAREKFYVNNPKVILSSMAFHILATLFHAEHFLQIYYSSVRGMHICHWAILYYWRTCSASRSEAENMADLTPFPWQQQLGNLLSLCREIAGTAWFFRGIRILNKNYKEKVCLRSELLSAMIKIFKGPFIIYTLGGGRFLCYIQKYCSSPPSWWSKCWRPPL